MAAGLSCSLLLPALSRAQSEGARAEKLRDMRKLIEVSGAIEVGVDAVKQLIAHFRSIYSHIPPQFWDDVLKEARVDEYVDHLVPIYDKHLTHDEVKELVRFYETPLGQKLRTTMPQINDESMRAGQAWTIALTDRVTKKMSEQGY